MGKMIEITDLTGAGRFGVYCAEPDTPPAAAVIVIQEVFGVNAGIRAKCDQWAEHGYLALAPDLFWHIEPGFEADPDAEDGLKRGIAMMMKFDQDQGIADIEAVIRHARAMIGDDAAKVGAVGFCMGGRLAYMVAARTDIDASAGFYAVSLDNLLHEAHAIARPLMLHIPTADHFVPAEIQQQVHAALDAHPRVTLYDYEGLDHGFADTFGKRRDEAGAALAEQRTAAFFAEHLA